MESNFIIIATGNEITAGEVVNTNASYLAQEITALSGEVIEHRSVRDGLTDIADCLRDALKKVNHVVVTGGLGPTTDDLTRNAVAEVSGQKLILSDEAWADITALFTSMGRTTGDGHKAQCHFPEGAERFRNKAGTADGFLVVVDSNKFIWVLPGPPRELKSVWQNGMRDKLKSKFPPIARQLHKWTFLGRGESEIADFAEVEFKGLPVQLGYRAKVPFVILKVWVSDSDLIKIGPALQKIENKFSENLVAKGNFDSVASLAQKIKSAAFYDFTKAGVFARRLLENKNLNEDGLSWHVTHCPSKYLEDVLIKYSEKIKLNSQILAKDISAQSELEEILNEQNKSSFYEKQNCNFLYTTLADDRAVLIESNNGKVKSTSSDQSNEIKIRCLSALWNRKITDDRLQLYFVEKFILDILNS